MSTVVLALAGARFGYGARPVMTHKPREAIPLPDPTPLVPPDDLAERLAALGVTLEPAAVARLGFSELVSCLRAGDTAKVNLERLERTAAASKVITPVGNVPHIADLHGYGAAKDWALELIEDVEAWRRGEIEFGDIAFSRNAVKVIRRMTRSG